MPININSGPNSNSGDTVGIKLISSYICKKHGYLNITNIISFGDTRHFCGLCVGDIIEEVIDTVFMDTLEDDSIE